MLGKLEALRNFVKHWLGWGKKQDTSVTATEKRQWVRYPSQAEIVYQPADGTQAKKSACIRDVSEGGICLLTDERFEPGSLLHVELPSPAEKNRVEILACVIHVTTILQPGRFALGCSFIRELTGKELQAFFGMLKS